MSADTFQIKRGTTAQVAAYLPAIGEPVLDVTLKQLHIGDGVTLGGVMVGTLTTPFMASLLNDPDATTALATLGAAPLASPVFTGVPAAPTAAVDTNTTQLASTAFVVGQAGAALPIIDGTAAAGTSLRYSRQDHVHPTDTSRAPLASPALTGTPTAPTAAIGTNTTQIATMAALQARILGTVSQSGGVPTGTIIETGGTLSGTGRYTKFADGTMIINKTLSIGTGATTAAGSIFRSTATSAGNFPVAFVTDAPVVQVTGTDSAGGGWAAMDVFPTVTTWGSYSTRAHVSQGTSCSLYLTAHGRWF